MVQMVLETWRKLCSNSWSSWPGRAQCCCCGCLSPCHLTSPSGSQHRRVPSVTQLLHSKNETEIGIIISLGKTQSCLLALNPKTVLGFTFSFRGSRSKWTIFWLYRIPDTASEALSRSTVDSVCTDPQVQYDTGKALGLDKEWFSKSEGSDNYFKFTLVNTHGGKRKIEWKFFWHSRGC